MAGKNRPNPKIKDVAALAEVSVTTVSRVLNGHPYVRLELRDKVDAAIKRLGYSPSAIARSLVTKKTNLIGVIVSDISASFFATILGSIEETASRMGYSILVCNIMEDLKKELRYLEIFKSLRVDGIILMHEATTQAIARFITSIGIPVVLSSIKPEGLHFPLVNIDEEAAAREATAYLADCGHRRIGLIGGELNDSSSSLLRYRGYSKALAEKGLPFDESIVRFGNYKMPDGYRLMGELLAAVERPTAVFCLSDDMAAGAMNRLADEGLHVPGDISVMGFDDSAIASMVRPALTTIHQPIADIGSASVEMLVKRIMGSADSISEIILSHSIVERASCGRI